MDRREILKYTAYVTGAAISLPMMSTFLSGCKVENQASNVAGTLHFFSKKEMSQLVQIIDTILPATDSPSASDVGVHQIIDSMVGLTYFKEDQKKYRAGIEALLNSVNTNQDGDLKSTLLSLDESTDDSVKEAYTILRQQTIAYYLSSEEIGKNYLNYLPVPGEYEGCISLEEVGGKAWAI